MVPPSARLDWATPDRLAKTALKGLFSPEGLVGGRRLEKHFAGHTFVELRGIGRATILTSATTNDACAPISSSPGVSQSVRCWPGA